MKHHASELVSQLERAKRLNCLIEDCGHSIKVKPQNKVLGMYILHKTQSAFHPLRRFLNRVEMS